jgi:hypothetical protein
LLAPAAAVAASSSRIIPKVEVAKREEAELVFDREETLVPEAKLSPSDLLQWENEDTSGATAGPSGTGTVEEDVKKSQDAKEEKE